MSQEKNNEGLNLSKKYASVLVKPTEKVIATYGNDYFQNIVLKNGINEFSFILTDKRLYYKGVGYNINGNGMVVGANVKEETLDLKDITKIGFSYSTTTLLGKYILSGIMILISIFIFKLQFNELWFFLDTLKTPAFHRRYPFPILCLIAIALFGIGLFMLIKCICSKYATTHTFLQVDYAGGIMKGNVALYGEESARDFLKQVKKAQDEYK